MKKLILNKYFIVFIAVFILGLLSAFNLNNSRSAAIPITMSSDNNYTYPMITSITSILENKNKDTKLDFYLLLSGDFEQGNKDKILSLQKKYSNCKITLIDMKNAMDTFYTSSHITKAAYYRLVLSSLLPDLKKVLYLDTDTIITKDLTELFSINIDEFYMAGVIDWCIKPYVSSSGYPHYEEVLKIKDLDHYINSGVILFNLEKMRMDEIEKKLIDTASKNKFICHDQDALNSVCYDKIKLLPPKYNAMMHCMFMNSGIPYEENEILTARNEPIVIHYSYTKPWNEINSYNKSNVWWEYAEKTDYFSEIKEKYPVAKI